MLRVDATRCSAADLAPAAEWLRRGGIVLFPTDTFYGLAVDPGSPAAVAALFDLKGRAAHAAVPIVAASRAQVEAWADLDARSARLADAWWPGPLSIVCPAPAGIAPAVHAGLGTIAIRVPDHRVARALAEAFGKPITATSANRSGEPPSRRAADCFEASDARVMPIDGGETAGGEPSTIVDARGDAPVCVRAGAIAWDRVLHSLQS